MTDLLLPDNSAWARLGDPALTEARAEEIADALEAGQIAACLPLLLEAGYSARKAREHDELIGELRSLPHYAIDEAVEQRAWRAACLNRITLHECRHTYASLLMAAGSRSRSSWSSWATPTCRWSTDT